MLCSVQPPAPGTGKREREAFLAAQSFLFNLKAAGADRQMTGQPVDLLLCSLARGKHLGPSLRADAADAFGIQPGYPGAPTGVVRHLNDVTQLISPPLLV